MKRDEQRLAEELVAELVREGVAARAEGEGVHWRVLVGEEKVTERNDKRARWLRIHCFWYGPGLGDLMLGMNPGNARVRQRSEGTMHQGAQYLTYVGEGEQRIADGRTYELEEVVAAAKCWMGGGSEEDLAHAAPHVGERRRAAAALMAQIRACDKRSAEILRTRDGCTEGIVRVSCIPRSTDTCARSIWGSSKWHSGEGAER